MYKRLLSWVLRVVNDFEWGSSFFIWLKKNGSTLLLRETASRASPALTKFLYHSLYAVYSAGVQYRSNYGFFLLSFCPQNYRIWSYNHDKWFCYSWFATNPAASPKVFPVGFQRIAWRLTSLSWWPTRSDLRRGTVFSRKPLTYLGKHHLQPFFRKVGSYLSRVGASAFSIIGCLLSLNLSAVTLLLYPSWLIIIILNPFLALIFKIIRYCKTEIFDLFISWIWLESSSHLNDVCTFEVHLL